MIASIFAPIIAFVTAISLLPLPALVPSVVVPEVPPTEPPAYTEVAYGSPLPAHEAVGDNWFENTAFIGHSLMQGLDIYTKFDVPDYYYLPGASTRSLLKSDSVILPDGSTGTLASGVRGKTYEKVYLMMGINEMPDKLSSQRAGYQNFLDTIQSYFPNAEIYVLAVIPVTRIKDAGGSFTIEKILQYNEMLKELCVEYKCWYVDLYTAFADSEGFLPSSASSDGIHLNKPQYELMVDYLRTHTAKQ